MKGLNLAGMRSSPVEHVMMKAYRLISVASIVAVISVVSGSVDMGKETPRTYIVSVRGPEKEMTTLSLDDRRECYASFLARTIPNVAGTTEKVDSRLMYAYQHVMTGFSAQLTEVEVETMRKHPDFVDAVPDGVLSVHTTYSSLFLGLNPDEGVWPQASFGKGVIIGVLDSGVWPESPSFDDKEIPPAPARWKGVCQTAPDWNSSFCNNKIIGTRVFNNGAKYYNISYDDTPRDPAGHGSHTASTAAGNSVGGADLFGYGSGAATGMAPLAHLAIYKVCFGHYFLPLCAFSDVLAGMDAAISDAVDVISMSIGGEKDSDNNLPLYNMLVAIGSFSAIEKGIFFSCSAGNRGPTFSVVENDAPWMMTVGASTMDRDFAVNAKLGNRDVVSGESLNPREMFKGGNETPLVLAGGNNLCANGSLDPSRIRGKLVVCDVYQGDGSPQLVQKGVVVQEAGGVGLILTNIDASNVDVEAHVLPTVHVGVKEGAAIKVYFNSTQSPTAKIYSEGTLFGVGTNADAPGVASFSSRGPSLSSPGILKPDVIAPGVAVLAAWPADVSPSHLQQDPRRVNFNTMSGTSMACPHVSGIAALLKGLHPDWSPAAIKSALMTTADIHDKKGRPILDIATGNTANVLAMGAGQVNPQKAADPGLIYDLTPQDYISYICGLHYTARQMFQILNKTVACPPSSDQTVLPQNLNYPSFALNVTTVPVFATFKRTVTNVGPANSTYIVNVVPPTGMKVTVNPTSLSFTALMEKKSYSVTFAAGKPNPSNSFSEGSITWISRSSVHRVRSPVSIIWN